MPRRFRIASVSFLNARPLIEGLDADPQVELALDVPSRLLDGLRQDRYDAALLPTIDYQRMHGLTILPAGAIGSDGPTLTVRVFSRVPVDQIRTLACDPDSHSSIALARIILARRHELHPECIDLRQAGDDPHQARLLIGDKVVCDEPQGFAHQLDLGDQWKQLTGMPFVFAIWMARPDADTAALNEILSRSRELGVARIDRIVRQHGVPRGWPAELALRYLTHHLQFEVGPRELEAIRLFHRLAAESGMIEAARELNVYRGADL